MSKLQQLEADLEAALALAMAKFGDLNTAKTLEQRKTELDEAWVRWSDYWDAVAKSKDIFYQKIWAARAELDEAIARAEKEQANVNLQKAHDDAT
tara:strand:- start:175 stop:459 length:285 start_codon:yes stop_codon:yes gene_type:complete